jgi:hypothetical protein
VVLVPPGIPPVAATAAAAIAATPTPAISATAASAAFAPVSASAASSAATIIVAAPSPATTAKPAVISRTRFVHTERASFDLLAVQLADRVLRIGLRSHRHKSEASGFPGEFILHQQHFGNCPGLRKHVLQLELCGRERQVAYVQSISHKRFGFMPQKAAGRLPEVRR